MKQYKYQINDKAYEVSIKAIEGDLAEVIVNGIPFKVKMEHSQLTEGNLPEVTETISNAASESAPAASAQHDEQASAAAPSAAGPGAGNPVKAPLPGVVTKILVKAGQTVKKGDTLVVLEAMKMENNITAEADGVVTGICVNGGESVLEGAVLVTIS